MDLQIKIHQKQRLAYIPKSIFSILGINVTATPGRAAVLMYSSKTPISNVLKSMDLIKTDLLHAKELQKGKK